jgi:hypothetical protein
MDYDEYDSDMSEIFEDTYYDPAFDDLEFYSRDMYLAEESPVVENTAGITFEELPRFIARIIECTSVSEKGTADFCKKFGVIYMISDYVRKHTDGWMFLFLNKEYIGAFSNGRDLNSEYKRRGGRFSIFRMYPERGFELSQVGIASPSVTYPIDPSENEETYQRYHLYAVNVELCVPNPETEPEFPGYPRSVSLPFKMQIDTGATITNSLFPEYIDDDYMYGIYARDEHGNDITDEDFPRQELLSSFNVGNDGILDWVSELADGRKRDMKIIKYDNVFIKINNELYVLIDAMTTYPKIKEVKPESSSNIFVRAASPIISILSGSRNTSPTSSRSQTPQLSSRATSSPPLPSRATSRNNSPPLPKRTNSPPYLSSKAVEASSVENELSLRTSMRVPDEQSSSSTNNSRKKQSSHKPRSNTMTKHKAFLDKKSQGLLGLNVLNRLCVEISQLAPNVAFLNLSQPKAFESSIFPGMRFYDRLTNYEIYSIKPGLELFCAKYRNLSTSDDPSLEQINRYDINTQELFLSPMNLKKQQGFTYLKCTIVDEDFKLMNLIYFDIDTACGYINRTRANVNIPSFHGFIIRNDDENGTFAVVFVDDLEQPKMEKEMIDPNEWDGFDEFTTLGNHISGVDYIPVSY